MFDLDTEAVVAGRIHIGALTTTPTQVRVLDKDGTAVETVAAGDIISLPRQRAPWEPVNRIQLTSDTIGLQADYVVEVTGVWGYPSVPGNVRQAVLEAISAALDRDVEHYSTDLGAQAAGPDRTLWW